MVFHKIFGFDKVSRMIKNPDNKYLDEINKYKENIINPPKTQDNISDNISNITLRYFSLLLYDKLMKNKIEHYGKNISKDSVSDIVNTTVYHFSVMVDNINSLYKMHNNQINPIDPNIVTALGGDIWRIIKRVNDTTGQISFYTSEHDDYSTTYPRNRKELIKELDENLHGTSEYRNKYGEYKYNIPSKNNMYKKNVNRNIEYNIYKTIKNKKLLNKSNFTTIRNKGTKIKLDEFDSKYVFHSKYIPDIVYNLNRDYINTKFKKYIEEYTEYINQCIAIRRLNKNAIRTVRELNKYIVEDIQINTINHLRHALILRKRERDLYKKDLTELQCKAINDFLKEIRIMYDKYELLKRKHSAFTLNPFLEVLTWTFDELSEYFRYNNHTLLLQDYNATDKKYEF